MEPQMNTDKRRWDGDERPYTVGSWKGLPQLQCKFCRFDTLEGVDEMMRHYEADHAPKPPPKIRLPFVDARGEPIEVEREIEDGQTEPHAADGAGDEN